MRISKTLIDAQENVQRRKYWQQELERFKPTKAKLRTGSSYYKRLMQKYTANKHGLKFVSGFKPVIIKSRHWFVMSVGGAGESFIVRLKAGVQSKNSRVNDEKMIFGAKISFGPKTVVIETIQGMKGTFALLNEFQTQVKMHYADFVVSEIERQAKEFGYKKVTLPDPKDLEYYKTPYKDVKTEKGGVSTRKLNENIPKEKAEIEGIRKGMEKLYYGAINNRGFVRHGSRFVKIL